MEPIEILDNATLEVVGYCFGPTATGACEEAGQDGVVRCAGCRVASVDADPQYWRVWVPPGSHHCPLAWSLQAH